MFHSFNLSAHLPFVQVSAWLFERDRRSLIFCSPSFGSFRSFRYFAETVRDDYANGQLDSQVETILQEMKDLSIYNNGA